MNELNLIPSEWVLSFRQAVNAGCSHVKAVQIADVMAYGKVLPESVRLAGGVVVNAPQGDSGLICWTILTTGT